MIKEFAYVAYTNIICIKKKNSVQATTAQLKNKNFMPITSFYIIQHPIF